MNPFEVVDADDFTVWRDQLGSPNALSNDDTVGPDDYTRWKTHFGESSGGGSGAAAGNSHGASTAVPEPSDLCMLLVVALAYLVNCFHAPKRET